MFSFSVLLPLDDLFAPILLVRIFKTFVWQMIHKYWQDIYKKVGDWKEMTIWILSLRDVSRLTFNLFFKIQQEAEIVFHFYCCWETKSMNSQLKVWIHNSKYEFTTQSMNSQLKIWIPNSKYQFTTQSMNSQFNNSTHGFEYLIKRIQ